MIELICKHCGKQFKVFPYRKDKAEYCSISCSKIGKNIGNTNGFKKGHITIWKNIDRKGIGGVKKGNVPWNKGVEMREETKIKLSEQSKGKHYSPNTQFKKGIIPWSTGKKLEYITGDKNINWKGGISTESGKLRKTASYLKWRNSIYERDNYICVKTKINSHNIVAHHILNFSEYPELRYNINNGITLDRNIHKEFHDKYGYKNNTKEQLLEFLQLEKLPFKILQTA